MNKLDPRVDSDMDGSKTMVNSNPGLVPVDAFTICTSFDLTPFLSGREQDYLLAKDLPKLTPNHQCGIHDEIIMERLTGNGWLRRLS